METITQTEARTRLAEEWKPMPGGWDGYEISNLGRVKSNRGVLKTEKMHTGYMRVQLYWCGIKKRYMVHRLVLEAFIGPCPKGHESSHLNGIRDDNRVDNLAWMTPKENAALRRDHKTARLSQAQ